MRDSVSSDSLASVRFNATASDNMRQAAGPFHAAPLDKPGVGGIVVTGLLVICPLFASVAAILIGLSLSGAGA
jgi:hypothetical protein